MLSAQCAHHQGLCKDGTGAWREIEAHQAAIHVLEVQQLYSHLLVVGKTQSTPYLLWTEPGFQASDSFRSLRDHFFRRKYFARSAATVNLLIGPEHSTCP